MSTINTPIKVAYWSFRLMVIVMSALSVTVLSRISVEMCMTLMLIFTIDQHKI